MKPFYLSLIPLLFFSPLSKAATLYVDAAACPTGDRWLHLDAGNGSSTNPYCSIQRALNATQPGDTVSVRPGTYHEKVEVVRGGNSTPLSGTLDCRAGESAVQGQGSRFRSELSAGDFIRCRAGYGFRWTEVKSVESDTQLTLVRGYRGPTALATAADRGRFIQLLGADRDTTIIDSYEARVLGGVTWSKVPSTNCVYTYQKVFPSPVPYNDPRGPWENPWGFHEMRPDTNYFQTTDSGADPYLWAKMHGCPWSVVNEQSNGSHNPKWDLDANGNGVPNEDPADLVAAMDHVGATWSKNEDTYVDSATQKTMLRKVTVYVRTRNCQDPNTIEVRANRNNGVLVMDHQPFTIVKNFTAWGSAAHSMRPSDADRLAFWLGASNTEFENLKAYNGAITFRGSADLTDLHVGNVAGMMKLIPPTTPPGSPGFSGVLMERIEARGGASNTSSNDGIWGKSAEDRVIFRGWRVHSSWTHKESPDCGEGNIFDWRNNRYVSNDLLYAGVHGLYIGSETQGQPTDHFTVENSIFELTGDGLGIFNGGGARDVIARNNIFGVGGPSSEHIFNGNSASSFGLVARNNIFFREANVEADSGSGSIMVYGGIDGLDSDYNLFLHPYHSGAFNVEGIANGQKFTLAQARSQNRELSSLEVSSGNSYFIDDSVMDGTTADYRLTSKDSPAVNRGDSSQCPEVDFDGNPRDGQCDIGPFEFSSGAPPAKCGDNRREVGEKCDGQDLAGATCNVFGFTFGLPTCKADCSGFDTASCSNTPGGGASGASGDGVADLNADHNHPEVSISSGCNAGLGAVSLLLPCLAMLLSRRRWY